VGAILCYSYFSSKKSKPLRICKAREHGSVVVLQCVVSVFWVPKYCNADAERKMWPWGNSSLSAIPQPYVVMGANDQLNWNQS